MRGDTLARLHAALYRVSLGKWAWYIHLKILAHFACLPVARNRQVLHLSLLYMEKKGVHRRSYLQ